MPVTQGIDRVPRGERGSMAVSPFEVPVVTCVDAGATRDTTNASTSLHFLGVPHDSGGVSWFERIVTPGATMRVVVINFIYSGAAPSVGNVFVVVGGGIGGTRVILVGGGLHFLDRGFLGGHFTSVSSLVSWNNAGSSGSLFSDSAQIKRFSSVSSVATVSPIGSVYTILLLAVVLNGSSPRIVNMGIVMRFRVSNSTSNV